MKLTEKSTPLSEVKDNRCNAVKGEHLLRDPKMIQRIVDSFEKLEKDFVPFRNSESKDIDELKVQYRSRFISVSRGFEKWASKRRMLMRDIDTSINDLIRTKQTACSAKLIFSTTDVIGTLGSIILNHFQNSWANKVLYSAAAFGCISFACSLIEQTQTCHIMDEILKKLRIDSESLYKIQNSLQKMYEFDKKVQDLFPHGIDERIVKLIQDPNSVKSKDCYQNIVETLETAHENHQICLAVLITNGSKDPTLLEDKNFLAKVRVFSTSSVAEKWWKRMKCQGMFPMSFKGRLLTELNTFSRMESFPLRTFPLLSAPPLHLNGLPTVGSLLLNSFVVLEAYTELTELSKMREVDVLSRLKESLGAEYKKIVDVYEQLSPYTD